MSIENFNFENKNTNNNEDEENTFFLDEEKVDFILRKVEFSSYNLKDIIEIKDKNLILISFPKSKNLLTSWYYDLIFTFNKYIISIINTNTYQIIANLFNLIEAEKLFYFGLRKFFKLNLLTLKKELIVSEIINGYDSYYTHYNIIPFLNKNKLLSFGEYHYGWGHNRVENKHCCLFDMKKNELKDINITNLDNDELALNYFPLKLNDDEILILFIKEIKLFKLKIE